MEISKIRELLIELDAQKQEPYPVALSLEYLEGGGSDPWRCEADNGLKYVVKAQNNGQDIYQQYRENGQPLKVLTTELICGRFGQLFEPIICPPVVVMDIPEKLASNNTYPNRKVTVSAGPSFGSQWFPGMIDIKQKGRFDLVPPPDQIVRIIVFQTWLRGEDMAALVSADGRQSLSIDHGYYLTGSSWEAAKLANPLPVSPVQMSQFRQQIDATVFQTVLEELQMLKESDIIKAFAAIPAEWGGTVEFRVELANYVLQRRDSVAQAISTIWKGASI